MDHVPGLTFCMPSRRRIEPTFENSNSNTCYPSAEVHQRLLISVPVAVLLCCTARAVVEILALIDRATFGRSWQS